MYNHCQEIDDLPESVTLLNNYNPRGDVLEAEWFSPDSPLKFKNGKPHVNAMLILANLIYWHRPIQERDESSDRVIGYRKKFKADLLQKSYSDYEESRGLTKKQIREALIFLEELGIVKREFRTINTPSGKINNVMYIHLNSQKVLELQGKTGPTSPFRDTPPSFLPGKEGVPSKEIGSSFQGKTYTKTTTKTSREGVLENASPSQEEVVLEKRKKGTRLDATWKLPNEYREWAISQGLFYEQLDRIADNFRDHWISTTKNATKLDWFATWRKWIRSECERRNIPPKAMVTEKVEVEIPSRTSNDPRIQRWYDMAPEFKEAAESKYGLGFYSSWLSPIECQEITDDHVIFMAPTRFIADSVIRYRDIFYEFMRKIVPTLGDGMNHPENCIEITYTEHNNAS